MIASHFLSKLVAGASLVLLIFVFVKTRSIDLDEHDRFRSELRRLTEIDAVLNQELLKSRHAHVSSYDALVENLVLLQHTLAALRRLPTFVSSQDQRVLREARAAYGAALTHKEQLIERFKSHNAVLRNSLNYFPLATSELIAQLARESPPHVQQLRQLLRDVLLYSLRTDEEYKRTILRHLRILRQIEQGERTHSNRRVWRLKLRMSFSRSGCVSGRLLLRRAIILLGKLPPQHQSLYTSLTWTRCGQSIRMASRAYFRRLLQRSMPERVHKV